VGAAPLTQNLSKNYSVIFGRGRIV
jgi:hypothetical protein